MPGDFPVGPGKLVKIDGADHEGVWAEYRFEKAADLGLARNARQLRQCFSQVADRVSRSAGLCLLRIAISFDGRYQSGDTSGV